MTEKSMSGMADGRYTFAVALGANKVEVRQAVERLWAVHVVSVNTMRMHGKKRSVGRSVGRRPDWKKAIVRLRSGERIPAFEGLL